MADVFTRLASRGRGGDGAVAARVPAVYETSRLPDSDVREDAAETVAPVAKRSVEPLGEERPHRTVVGESAVAPVRPAYRAVAEEAQPRGALEASPQPSEVKPPQVQPPQVQPPQLRSSAVVGSAAATPAARLQAMAVQPDSPRPDRIRPLATTPPAETLAETPAETSAAIRPRSAAVPHADGVESAAQSRSAEPAVQISIGRIEIRALPPAPSPEASETAVHANASSGNLAGLSLSAYLRGDDGRPR
jgi:hypothetical protein